MIDMEKIAGYKIFIWIVGLMLPLISLAKEYQIQHLEPANWWVGMKYHQVELMVHGDNIGETQPDVDYPGVDILAVAKADSPNYLFVTLDIGSAAKPGKFPIRFLKGGIERSRFNYELLTREKN